MKKNYIVPQIDVIFYEPVVMDTATKATGIIHDDDDNENGRIDWGGESDPGHDPSAKNGSNLWDGWDD